MDRPSKFPTAEAMKEWVHALQKWIENDTADHDDAVFSDDNKLYVLRLSILALSDAPSGKAVMRLGRDFRRLRAIWMTA